MEICGKTEISGITLRENVREILEGVPCCRRKTEFFTDCPQTVSSKSTAKNRKKYGENLLNVRWWNVIHLYTCAKTITTKTIYI